MATYTQILYHIVYGTKNHTGTLDLERHDEPGRVGCAHADKNGKSER